MPYVPEAHGSFLAPVGGVRVAGLERAVPRTYRERAGLVPSYRGVQKNDESSAHARNRQETGTRMVHGANHLAAYCNAPRLLVAVNPYAVLPIYGEASMAAHSAAALGTIAPHIYGTSAA